MNKLEVIGFIDKWRACAMWAAPARMKKELPIDMQGETVVTKEKAKVIRTCLLKDKEEED